MVLKKQHSAGQSFNGLELEMERALLYEVLRERKVTVRDRVLRMEFNLAAVQRVREAHVRALGSGAAPRPGGARSSGFVELSDLLIASINGAVEARVEEPCTLAPAEFDASWLPGLLDQLAALGVPMLAELQEQRRCELRLEVGLEDAPAPSALAAAPPAAASAAQESQPATAPARKAKQVSFAPDTRPDEPPQQHRSVLSSVANKLRKGLLMAGAPSKETRKTKTDEGGCGVGIGSGSGSSSRSCSSGNGGAPPPAVPVKAAKEAVQSGGAAAFDKAVPPTSKRKLGLKILRKLSSIKDLFAGKARRGGGARTAKDEVEGAERPASPEALEGGKEAARAKRRGGGLRSRFAFNSASQQSRDRSPGTSRKSATAASATAASATAASATAVSATAASVTATSEPAPLSSQPSRAPEDKHDAKSDKEDAESTSAGTGLSASASSSASSSPRAGAGTAGAGPAGAGPAGAGAPSHSQSHSREPTKAADAFVQVPKAAEGEFDVSVDAESLRARLAAEQAGEGRHKRRSSDEYEQLRFFFKTKLIASLRSGGSSFGEQGSGQSRSTGDLSGARASMRSRLAHKSRSTVLGSSYSLECSAGSGSDDSFKRAADYSSATILDETLDTGSSEEEEEEPVASAALATLGAVPTAAAASSRLCIPTFKVTQP
jgi:hypothetical protein